MNKYFSYFNYKSVRLHFLKVLGFIALSIFALYIWIREPVLWFGFQILFSIIFILTIINIMVYIRGIDSIVEYEKWLKVVIKEEYIDVICKKYNINRNNVMPLHLITNHLEEQFHKFFEWSDVTMSCFIFNDNQLYIYEEIYNPRKSVIVSKNSNFYYYNDITNFRIEETSGAIRVKFIAGNTTFNESFDCKEGDGTYDSIMFLKESVNSQHKSNN